MDRLERAGAELRVGHSPMNIQREGGRRVPSALVVSSAIPGDNVEIRHADSAGIPVYDLDLAKFVFLEFVWSNWLMEDFVVVVVVGIVVDIKDGNG